MYLKISFGCQRFFRMIIPGFDFFQKISRFRLLKSLLFSILISLPAIGQNLRPNKANEIGVFLGGSYYIGDLNPTKHFKYTRPAAGLLYRRVYNYRFALRITGNFGYIKGDDSSAEYAFRRNRNLNFTSYVAELAGAAEFNFLPYEIGDSEYRFTPFVFGGLACFMFNPKTNFNGEPIKLQKTGTEGQTAIESKKYLRIQPSIPFGIGFKYNLFNNFGLSLEWGLRKTFTDYLDDVSKTYLDKSNILNGDAGELSDQMINDNFKFRSNAGRQRGISTTKDWYSFAGLTIVIRLVPKDINCRI